ncbi:MAG: glycosyltransferase [bacterium]|nr:glycosyltransferase [bacterium]
MAVYLISSDLYTIRINRKLSQNQTYNLPTVTIIVPAHNEEFVITRTLQSIYNSNYPADKLDVIIVNDGSTDNTKVVVEQFQSNHKDRFQLRIINRPNQGKAGSLNYALRKYATGSLIMCLDADSSLEVGSLKKAVQYFKDRQVVALSSNVNIIEDGSLMSLVQRFEYIVCYQMKKGQAYWGTEYIIGGIGSMFRRSMLSKVSYYDTNTITEDIDLTLKILINKTKHQTIAYAADSITHTEAAHSLSALMRQRFRWKYGRTQTFFKNKKYFFSGNNKHAKRLTWFMLPYSIFQDLMFLFEPFVIGWFIYLTFAYGDIRTVVSSLVVMSIFLLFNIWGTLHIAAKSKLRLSLMVPVMYILMFILTFAEYYALIKSLIMLPKIKKTIQGSHLTWKSPERKQASV